MVENSKVLSRGAVAAVFVFTILFQFLAIPTTFADSSDQPNESVCFSPNGNCDVALVNFIKSARHTLEIAVFDITNASITQAIIDASKTVSVRVIVDRREAAGRSSTVDQLVQAGVPLKIGKQKGIMHNKFTVADGAALETGSYNYSDNATYNNNENQIYMRSPAIVAQYESYFESMWAVGTEYEGRSMSRSTHEGLYPSHEQVPSGDFSALPACDSSLKAGTVCVMPSKL